jgi:hypothetical protein
MSWMSDRSAPAPIVPAKQSDLLRLTVRAESKVARRVVFLAFVLLLAAVAGSRLRAVVATRRTIVRGVRALAVGTRAPPRAI